MLKKIIYTLVFISTFFFSGCAQPLKVTNLAYKVPLKKTKISQKEAKKMLRDSLLSVLRENPYETNVPFKGFEKVEAKMANKHFAPFNYKGAKSANNKKSVFFLYANADAFNSDYFRKSALFIDVGENASVEIFKIPTNVFPRYTMEGHYALLIKNTSICRAYYIDKVNYINGNWGFHKAQGVGNAACFGKTRGSIKHPIVSSLTHMTLNPVLGSQFYYNYAIIEHKDKNKLEDLANIFRMTFNIQ